MKVLFLTSDGQDNLEDSLLHGLRTLLGPDCVDFPKKEVLYRGYAARPAERCYANLFTVWRTLEDVPVDRMDVERRLAAREFDLVVLGSVHRILPRWAYLLDVLKRSRTVAVDGEDHGALAAQALRFVYFKRELDWKARLVWYRGARSRWLRLPVPTAPLGIEPLAFSIPAEKIVAEPLPAAGRTSDFPRHIVDPEVRTLLEREAVPAGAPGSVAAERGYVHDTEEAYYADLRRALFGVTTKRGGWDCLRHYEIAANGTILCFRDLDRKPRRCAPEGLGPASCLAYSDAGELLARTRRLTIGEKDALIAGAHRWARGQTTEVRARHFLDVVRRRFDG